MAAPKITVDAGCNRHLFELQSDTPVGKQTARTDSVLSQEIRLITDTTRRPGCSARILQGFFEGASERHHFADRFHFAGDLAADKAEFLQIPPWHFDRHVVERRFEICARHLGDGVLSSGNV